MRWGRVGKNGQTSITHTGSDLDKAKDVFCKKFLDKTKNDWLDKNSFIKVNIRWFLEFVYVLNSFKQFNLNINYTLTSTLENMT